MPYTLTFAEAAAAGPALTGGKGWNTGRLEQFGFRIPRGCVVTAVAYWDFLQENRLTPIVQAMGDLSGEEAAAEGAAQSLETLRLQIAAGRLPDGLVQEVRQSLTHAGIPPETGLAVRSSATAEDSSAASFAGIHRSFLNVVGDDALEQAIRSCYASLWTPTAVAYRRTVGLSDHEVGAALVIQELVPALYSGVAFSADPVTGRRDRVVVNAALGLGESVVAGSVEADEYHLHIDHTGPAKLVGGRIGQKHHAVRPHPSGGTYQQPLGITDRSEPVLSKSVLDQIARLVQRIQDTLGDGVHPQDVEWCHNGFHVVITQARPITALPEATFLGLAGQPTIWSNANLKDAMPGVQSPLGWWFNSLTAEVLLRQIFWKAGYDFPEGLNWSRLFNGRAYLNLSAVQWAAYDAFGWQPADTNRALGGHQPEIRTPLPAPLLNAKGWARFRRLLRMGRIMRKATRQANSTFRAIHRWCKKIEQERILEQHHDLHVLRRLWTVEKKRRDFLPETMIHNVGGLWSTRLEQWLERRFPGRGLALASALLTGTEGITSAEQGYRLVAVARQALAEEPARYYFLSQPFVPDNFRRALQGTRTLKMLEQFLQEFGHRGVYEMEIMNPRWSEDPSFVLDTVRGFVRDGLPEKDPLETAREKRLAAEAQVRGWSRFSPVYRFLLHKARESMRLREEAKSALVRLVRPTRLLSLALGDRLATKGLLSRREDVFYLTGDEIASLVMYQWDGRGIDAILEYRKALRLKLEATSTPDVIVGQRAVVNLWPEQDVPELVPGKAPAKPGTGSDPSRGILQGVAVSSGKAQGRARLIRHPTQGSALRRGEILVAPSTDPAWTPLFLRASAIVMEVGGYLSHGAIVAREYGIPAVVNVAGAMEVFHDGQMLQVDGSTGRVTAIMSSLEDRA